MTDWLDRAGLGARRPRPADLPIWLLGMLLRGALGGAVRVDGLDLVQVRREVMTLDIEWLPREVTLDNYLKVFEYPIASWGLNSLDRGRRRDRALRALRRDGRLCAGAAALSRPRRCIFILFLASLMIPPEVSVIPLLLGIVKIGWASTYQALILPTDRQRPRRLHLPPVLPDLSRASWRKRRTIDGAGPFSIFFRIALPLARAPAIAATVIVFTLNWNNFLWPLLVTFDEDMKTLPVGIAAFAPVVGTHTQLEGYGVAMAAVTLLCIPCLLLFFFLQRYFIEGITQGSVKQ